MGLEGSGWRLREARGRRRYTKVLVLQECFHSRYALGIVAILAIKTRGYASVVPGASYTYEVHALDAALNDSGPSNTASVMSTALNAINRITPANTPSVI